MRGTAVVFDDFRGGVNLAAAPYDVAPNQARDVLNVTAKLSGGIKKRAGSAAFAAPMAYQPVDLFASEDSDWLIASGAEVYSINSAGIITTIGALSVGGHAEPSWIRAPAIGGQGPFYGTFGSAPRHWTGAGSTAAWTSTVVDATHVQVPIGRYILYHGNRVWIAGPSSQPSVPGGGTADPSGLYFSNIGDPRDWPSANIVRFDPFDGDEITGLGTAGPYILIFKRNKVWLVTNTDTGANRLISRNLGCVAAKSIVETPIGTIFLSKRGVMVANHNDTQLLSDNEKLSDPISPYLEGLPASSLHLAAGAYFDNYYYLSVVLTDGTRQMLAYDLRLRSWWIHTLQTDVFAVWQERLYGVPPTKLRIDRLFIPGVTQDPDANYSATWKGPYLTFGKPGIRKRCREIRVDGKGSASIGVFKDYNTAETAVGTGFTGANAINEATVHSPGVARAWSLSFGNSAAADFEIESYTMSMTERSD